MFLIELDVNTSCHSVKFESKKTTGKPDAGGIDTPSLFSVMPLLSSGHDLEVTISEFLDPRISPLATASAELGNHHDSRKLSRSVIVVP